MLPLEGRLAEGRQVVFGEEAALKRGWTCV